jgi:hypothetical protein
MHAPRSEAQKARVALQSIYDRYLEHICGVKYATHSTSEGCRHCRIFGGDEHLNFGLRYLLVQLGRLLEFFDDAFSVGDGAKNFSGSIATCL